MSAMTFSDAGIEFLIGWEALRLAAYKDQAGKLTIGIGHLLTADEIKTGIIVIDGDPHAWRSGITRDSAMALKRQDLRHFTRAVSRSIKHGLEQHEFDALVCLAYNIGEAAFAGSSVAEKINAGAPEDQIRERWMVWNKVTVNGIKRVSAGLANRRKAETAVYFDADYSGMP